MWEDALKYTEMTCFYKNTHKNFFVGFSIASDGSNKLHAFFSFNSSKIKWSVARNFRTRGVCISNVDET